MNKTIAAATLAALALALAGGAAHATSVGVSVEISQPGVYGRVDIGRYPQPQLIVQQPVLIGRPVAVAPQPVYMWVPVEHRRNWRRYCRDYRACGVPVYFVDHRWYRGHVMPARAVYDGDRGPRGDDRRGGPPGPRHDDRDRGPQGHGHGPKGPPGHGPRD
ncbi:hypothetical protein [Rubrivivax gelatinosus]|uniref:Uncharacterized protein n=1 Tax=Rubrivivax gelatinosus TaxID=28068 RepID=A0ABS1DVD3_RUBGE|nr:hypothetical protein [Rubrivivax gelatinosus]MBK1713952.1 hypothetical protein [Rubrivivax gelatinosus]